MSSNSSFPTQFLPPRTPLQNFCIRWDRPSQQFNVRKVAWTRIERPIPLDSVVLLNWGRTSQRPSPSIGDRFSDIFFTRTDIGFDDEWFFEHALGRGGFGAVALFACHEKLTQDIIDKVVVKTAKSKANLAIDPSRQDLSVEAALMGQTNDLGKDGMLALRQFKSYPNDSQWKYYFEYCPYGDLERLRMRYKAYGRYLPEFFLWHLFYWLAKTLREYSSYNQWHDMDLNNWGSGVPNGYLLHCDIKTQNIFLGPPDPDQSGDVSLYPIPRVADLGLAEIQSEHQTDNWAAGLYKGTTLWLAPEVRYPSMDPHSDFYPFGSRPHSHRVDQYRKAQHPITSKANLWAIGAVMYSMMSLNEIDTLSDLVDQVLTEQIPLPRRHEGNVLLGDVDFSILDPQYYSLELRDLINECLHIVPTDRPSEEDLLNRTRTAYGHWLNVANNQLAWAPSIQDGIDADPRYKVYYHENEIHYAPDNYRFQHPDLERAWWSHHFIRDLLWLPSEWGVLWPRWMPEDVVPPSRWPKALRTAFFQRAQEMRADRNGEPAVGLLTLAAHYHQQQVVAQLNQQAQQQAMMQRQLAQRGPQFQQFQQPQRAHPPQQRQQQQQQQHHLHQHQDQQQPLIPPALPLAPTLAPARLAMVQGPRLPPPVDGAGDGAGSDIPFSDYPPGAHDDRENNGDDDDDNHQPPRPQGRFSPYYGTRP